MKLAEVQDDISARIVAVEALAAFGTPLLFSLALDDDAFKADIAARLREKGVCIEIGSVSGDDSVSVAGRFAALNAHFDVFVAENPKVAHDLANIQLVTAVIQAVTARTSAHDTAPKCTAYEAAKSEQGYVLHVISFSVPAQIP